MFNWNYICSHDHIEILVNAAGELLFFRQREGPWMPTLKLFHKCKFSQRTRSWFTKFCYFLDPFFVTMQQVDKGAIRFVLSGANIMCPGLTSPGAKMTEAPKGTVVVNLWKISFFFITIKCFLILGYNGWRKGTCFSYRINDFIYGRNVRVMILVNKHLILSQFQS